MARANPAPIGAPVSWSRALRVAVDVAVLGCAYALGFLLRFDWQPPWPMVKRFAITLPYVVAFKYALLHYLGITRFAWRHLGLREAVRVLQALFAATFVLLLVRALLGQLAPRSSVAAAAILPYGVLAIDFVLAFLGITGVRVLRRITAEKASLADRPRRSEAQLLTLLIGANELGLSTVRQAEARPELGITVVGFLDDDPDKLGTVLHGIPVLGKTQDILSIAMQLAIGQILITVPDAPGALVKAVHDAGRQLHIPVKIVPSLRDVGQQRSLGHARPIELEDLLRRAPVNLDLSSIERYVAHRTVLVTGAGGSIGSELSRQLAQFKPAALLLVDRAENNLFFCEGALQQQFPQLNLQSFVADVTDVRRMAALFAQHRPAVVFHAAAHKHVPLMEQNPLEAVKNNVFGTKVVADLAHRHGADHFVLISTDKAVNPSSVMGATKRVAELYIQALGAVQRTRYCAVRFGNVLGSTGSVVPLFRAQIAAGGPVTVTHPDMERYFMTIDEACQLVLQAAALGEKSEIFVLDMGAPMKIVDLARDLIRLSGLREDDDIHIVYSGIRQGEKLQEQLANLEENSHPTKHPKIFVGKIQGPPLSELEALLLRLQALVDREAPASEVRAALQQLVPEYHEWAA
jgi:FlaA1/EpsC-like NDP-sugar epimerase